MSVDWVPLLMFLGAMVATPGPANMVLLAAGARFGLRASLPFVAGVAVGKQLIIWPLGFGLLAVLSAAPVVFAVLKYGSALYVLYLAWRILGSRITPGEGTEAAPRFAAGLIVHPLNPKAWAMVVAAFTQYVPDSVPALQGTALIAATLLAVQLVLHPLWCWGGAALAASVAGRRAERLLMTALAVLTVAAVALAVFGGNGP